MGLPTSREQTYVTGVTKVQAVDMNAIQDGIVELNQRVVWDHFTGSAIDTGRWNAATATLVADDANGGAGATTFANGQSIATTTLAIGTSCRFRARMRTTGVSATTSIRAGLDSLVTTGFLISGASSTTNWRVMVDGVNTAPNGTAAAISATYKDFEVRIRSGTLTFLVNDVVLHSQAYATSVSGDTITIINAVAGGAAHFVDWVTFGPIP
jgi:sulfur carrier protein ThiS